MRGLSRRHALFGLLFSTLGLANGGTVDAQSRGEVVFVTRRPPREISGNIRSWAGANQVRSYNEDTTAHVWRVQFMAFLSRPPNAAEVTLVFYEMNGRTRRFVTSQSIALSNPAERIFYHNTTLHRSPDEFQPMKEYQVAITVNDARGAREVAAGRVGLVGQVDRVGGVVDFTGNNGPTVR